MAGAAGPAAQPAAPGAAPQCALSPEARAFLAQSCPDGVEWETADLSCPAKVAELRGENSAVGADHWRVAREQLRAEGAGVAVREGAVGGVPCQWVTPLALADGGAGSPAPESADWPPPGGCCRGAEVVLYFFGGAFVVGSPEDDLSMTARLAHSLARRVCAPRYRLAPEHPFPAAREDARAVYRALRGRGDVLVVGESAGGNLALRLVLDVLAAPGEAGPPLAVGLLSPWVDLTHSGESHHAPAGTDPTLSVPHFLAPASAAYAGGAAAESDGVSPLFARIPAGFPPTVISSATRDLLLSDSARLADRLREAGAGAVELHVAEGLWHVFEWYPRLPEAVRSLRSIAAFLEQFCVARAGAGR
eukprot:TRINITY_DN27672_c0_g1_i2.p2 TRINITY_DN27672_c0_g1~~TRINITY_DN27672_c0_g1_i2.p2  ORF type:complete len:384 (+),score=93.49 TRINITY_DN27672_c0_g1_i2:67-1152(+)